MTASGSKAAFWRGVRGTLPFLIVVGPFALLFGVVATEAGLDILAVMGFSVLVIAGAAQFTAVQLMTDQAPTFIIILTALTVNLRTAMYSAALTPHLGAASLRTRMLAAYLVIDQPFAVSLDEYEKRPDMTLAEKTAFFFGTAAPLVPTWFAMTLVGALLGKSIPPDYALDFAVPITFLAMLAPMLKTVPHIIAAGVSVIAMLGLSFIPYNGGLLLAGLIAMVAGAEAERQGWGKR